MLDYSLTAVKQVAAVTVAGLAVTVTATRLRTVKVTAVTVAVSSLWMAQHQEPCHTGKKTQK